MREKMPKFMKEAALAATVAAGFAGEAHADEGREAREHVTKAAMENIGNNRDSLNIEYKPITVDAGIIALQSERNNTLDQDGNIDANAPEMQLELRGEAWHMVPKTDSFNWLAKETHMSFDGFIVDPNSKESLNAAINAVIGSDAVLDRYMRLAANEQAPDEKTDSSDPFGSMLEGEWQRAKIMTAVTDALAYIETTPFTSTK